MQRIEKCRIRQHVRWQDTPVGPVGPVLPEMQKVIVSMPVLVDL